MRIYFAASISGGRRYLPACTRMVEFLKDLGHTVLTEHIVAPDVLSGEMNFTAQQIYERDTAWLESCDRVVAEVSNPSLGVGYEICYALHFGKPVIALHEEGLFISRMITGISQPGITVTAYRDEAGWRESLIRFLEDAR
ncbi:MAG TPA: nucleoside 2-deoxyribosyltransferase [bacterium]|nr:nucleoside 2-deoxyribosyltransferase [bacterium]